MIGKTNVGGSSTFSAVLQITTDASASIYAVNPAGDSYSGTANSSGSLTLNIGHPGTYTVTASVSGASASGTVAVADNDGVVSYTIYTWSGQLYYRGEEYEAYTGGWIASTTHLYNPFSSSLAIPTLTSGSTSLVAEWNPATSYGYIGGVRITDTFDITDYDTITIVYEGSTPNESVTETAALSLFICSADNADATGTELTSITSEETTAILDISSYTGSYYVGVTMRGYSQSYHSDQIVTIHSVVCS